LSQKRALWRGKRRGNQLLGPAGQVSFGQMIGDGALFAKLGRESGTDL
jgi:hypothetical protein